MSAPHPAFQDLTGKTLAGTTVQRRATKHSSRWLVLCLECGQGFTVHATELRRKHEAGLAAHDHRTHAERQRERAARGTAASAKVGRPPPAADLGDVVCSEPGCSWRISTDGGPPAAAALLAAHRRMAHRNGVPSPPEPTRVAPARKRGRPRRDGAA